MNNKELGSSFEKEYADILSEYGFWVTFLTPKKHVGSQPCDLIAIKNDKTFLIDCKTCKSHLFPIDRIEENQRQAYEKYRECGNKDPFILAIKHQEKIIEINMDTIDFNKKNIDLRGITDEDNCIKQYKNTRT